MRCHHSSTSTRSSSSSASRCVETFEADIAYVALHDETAGRIEFAYYYESGERRSEAPMEYGEGLTSQILDSREPLSAQPEGAA